MTTSDPARDKQIRLRYSGVCRRCGVPLAAGVHALYFRDAKQVECISCPGTSSPSDAGGGSPSALSERPEVEAGTAGASARREHERRVVRRENRVRAAHPRLGGLIMALTDEPQSTRAWERGAVGEEKLARTLDALQDRGARVLHDRRIPRTRANIDHILIAPAGVFVIDAKRYTGRPHLRVDGGILRPRVETLMVGRRDCSRLVAGVRHQVELVTTTLGTAAGSEAVLVRGVLCFIDADWPVFGGAFATSNVDVLWPQKLAERVFSPLSLSAERVADVHASLAARFPCA